MFFAKQSTEHSSAPAGVEVLSGGEKMRCMISKMMLLNPNALILDKLMDYDDYVSDDGIKELREKCTGKRVILIPKNI